MFCISALVRTRMYTYTHKETGCKGTKKNSYMQIYEEKSAENVNFVREMGGFDRIEGGDNQKNEKNH